MGWLDCVHSVKARNAGKGTEYLTGAGDLSWLYCLLSVGAWSEVSRGEEL